MEHSSRACHLYRIVVGLIGIAMLAAALESTVRADSVFWLQAAPTLALFILFSLIIKRAGVHITPGVTHSLVGIVDVAVLIVFGPAAGAVVATMSCLIYLLLRTWRHQTPDTRVEMLEVTLFSSGLKALIALCAGWLYGLAGGHDLKSLVPGDSLALLALFSAWFFLDHLAWGISQFLQGGMSQVIAFLRATWLTSLLVEFLPLWTSVIIVFVYQQHNKFVFWLLALSLVAVSLVLQRMSDMWESIQRRLAELTALSDIGKAIVSAQPDEDELCELIYQQASEIVDTSTFHLGLFDQDDYVSKIWVKDSERQPSQAFSSAANEGIVGWLRRSRLPLLVRDFEREMDRLPARPHYISDRPPRSGIFVPLVAGDQVIGTMSIQSFQPAAFNQDHLRLLSVIGNQAAMAIEKVRLYLAEQRRARQLALIEHVSRKVTSILELETLFVEVVRLIQETFGYYHVSILSLVQGGNTIALEAGTASSFSKNSLQISVGEGIVGWVAQHGEPLLVNDVSQDERYTFSQALPQTCAELAVPLQVGSRVLGVLDVQGDRVGAFCDDDLFILQTLAAQVAIAIEDARLYIAQQEDAWVTTALLQVAEATSKLSNLADVLSTVVRLTPLLTGVDRCGIFLLEKGAQAFVPAQAYGITQEQYAQFATLRLPAEQTPVLAQAKAALLSGPELYQSLPAPLIEAFDFHKLLVLPLSARGETLGVMLVGYVEEADTFTGRKVDMIAGIANQAAIAIENAQLYTAQQKEAYVSAALLQVSEAVRSLNNIDDILSTIVRITPILAGVQQCAILLWKPDKQQFLLAQSYGLSVNEEEKLENACLDPDCSLARTLLNGQPALSVRDAPENHQAAQDVTFVAGDLNMLALPLLAKGRVLGMLAVDYSGVPEQFVGQWLNILSGIADQSAIAIENMHLYQQEAERQRLERELEVAREIQASFLPDQRPQLPGWELDAYWQAARQVGGDFYDMFSLPDGRFGLVIADVADKGIPAALFMALSRTLVRVVAQEIMDPAQVLERTNDLIISDTRSGLFVTVFYGILDPSAGTLVYANGGHNSPLLVRYDGQVEALRARGIVLGIVSPIHLELKTAQFAPGDVLVMYTDGVTDAINTDEEEFGTAHLAEIARRTRTLPPTEIIRTVFAELDAFTGDVPQFDDFTLMVVKRLEEEP